MNPPLRRQYHLPPLLPHLRHCLRRQVRAGHPLPAFRVHNELRGHNFR